MKVMVYPRSVRGVEVLVIPAPGAHLAPTLLRGETKEEVGAALLAYLEPVESTQSSMDLAGGTE